LDSKFWTGSASFTHIMVSGTLYTYPSNFRAEKVLAVAKFSNADVKVDDKFVFGETNKSEAFLKKFPLGKVPAFEGADGTCLFESDAIAYYVANKQMRGGDSSLHQALVAQYVSFAQNEVLPAACTWVFPTMGIMQFNKTSTDRAKVEVKVTMDALNKVLLTKTYLVGERITLADISVAYAMKMLFENVLDPEFRKPYGNVVRWYTTIMNQPQVIAVSGQPKLAEKMAQFDAKKYAEMSGKGDAKKEAKKEKKEQAPKKAEPKKEAKKKEAEEEEPAMPAPVKEKDPFAALPAGTWVMDDFKRFYSNNDEDKSIPYFWEKFDHDNYSIWHCEYLYPEELRATFMSSNLVGGMFQRLDKLRKYAFASVAVFGESNNSSISGIWVWRGQDLAFEMSEDLQIDYSSYKWTKLDSKSEETKKMVEDFFKWQGTDKQGRPFCNGKIYK